MSPLPLQFDDSLTTGIDEIDAQHRELFELGVRCMSLSHGEADRPALTQAVNTLQRYVVEHLAAEEKAMKLLAYDRLVQHKLAHDQFRHDVQHLATEVASGADTRALQARVHFLLSDWLSQHIRYMDTRLAGFIRDAGGKTALTRVRLERERALRDDDTIGVVVPDADARRWGHRKQIH